MIVTFRLDFCSYVYYILPDKYNESIIITYSMIILIIPWLLVYRIKQRWSTLIIVLENISRVILLLVWREQKFDNSHFHISHINEPSD